MKFRSTIVYLVAAIVLVALYLYESRREQQGQESGQEARMVLRMDPASLDRITLERGAELIRLEKSGVSGEPVWEITAPIRSRAEDFSLGQLTGVLTNLNSVRVISEKAENLGPFGLERPTLIISYRAGGAEGSLSLGSESPVEQGCYVRRGEEKKVFLIGRTEKYLLDRSLFDLRNKKVFSLNRDRITRLSLTLGQGVWNLVKEEGRWRFEGDPDFVVDGQEVESLLRRIAWEEATAFEEEEADDLTPYGLDDPQVRVLLSDDERTEELILGDARTTEKGEHLYAKVVGRPQVMTVNKRFLKKLPDSREALRKKEEKTESGTTP